MADDEHGSNPLKLSSIRWWLPLSYGAIAFMTAVLLGGILLLGLRSYYTFLERRYLDQNALAVSAALEQTRPVPHAEALWPSQIDTFAYLTQTQIRLFDAAGNLVAESGRPQDLQAVATVSFQVQTDEARQEFSQTVGQANGRPALTSLMVVEVGGGRFMSESSVSGDVNGVSTVTGFAAPLLQLETPHTIGQAGQADERSGLVLRRQIAGFAENDPVLWVELSQGPAFGQLVLVNVGWGIAVAGGVAVVLATAVGWVMSRRLSQPIAELVDVTRHMAEGDLSVRTLVARPDELSQLGHAFNEMAGRIEQTIATLRHFVADAAHELNTPLTALRTNLELAAKSIPANEPLARAQAQALRLQHLNDHLLHLSRLESGVEVERRQPIDLSSLLAAQNERFAARAEQAGLTFDTKLPGAPLVVFGSAQHIAQAMENLLDNAFKFTPAGGAVRVTLTAAEGWAHVTVRDTGIGILADDIGLIFGRFHRGRNAGEYPGSGLGLAIVQRIAEVHGGKVTAVPLPTGTEVTLRLPQSLSLKA